MICFSCISADGSSALVKNPVSRETGTDRLRFSPCLGSVPLIKYSNRDGQFCDPSSALIARAPEIIQTFNPTIFSGFFGHKSG